MLHVVALRSTGEAEGMERALLPSTVVSLVTAAVLLSVCLSAAGLGRERLSVIWGSGLAGRDRHRAAVESRVAGVKLLN